MFREYYSAAVVAANFLLLPSTVSALSIRDFRKHLASHQAVYIGAAVSMAAYNYAVNGDVDKARCIQRRHFGEDPPGPREIAVEIEIAERQDADRFHVEGIILGVLDRACGSESPDNSKSSAKTSP